MRKTISVSALILALVCSAHAGEIQNDKPSPPPQPPSSAAQQATPQGEIQNDVADSLTQIALNVLAVLPSLS